MVHSWCGSSTGAQLQVYVDMACIECAWLWGGFGCAFGCRAGYILVCMCIAIRGCAQWV